MHVLQWKIEHAMGMRHMLLSLYLCLSDSEVLSEEPQVCNDAVHVSFAIGEETLSSGAGENIFHSKNIIFLSLWNEFTYVASWPVFITRQLKSQILLFALLSDMYIQGTPCKMYKYSPTHF